PQRGLRGLDSRPHCDRFFFFFFQAEDGIRDRNVTGVKTCALPISGQLRRTALQAADDDAAASRAFGAAFTLPRGPQRTDAIHQASLEAAESSAVLGEHAVRAIDDAVWLAEKGNPSLIADVMVAFGALRTALTAARTNVSFDLASLRSSGFPLEEIRKQQPQLWTTVETFDAAIDRIDAIMAAVDDRAAPTDSA